MGYAFGLCFPSPTPKKNVHTKLFLSIKTKKLPQIYKIQGRVVQNLIKLTRDERESLLSLNLWLLDEIFCILFVLQFWLSVISNYMYTKHLTEAQSILGLTINPGLAITSFQTNWRWVLKNTQQPPRRRQENTSDKLVNSFLIWRNYKKLGRNFLCNLQKAVKTGTVKLLENSRYFLNALKLAVGKFQE